jgi:hypothetical protein
MTDNAGYRPTDDSALRWEDTHCTKCGERDRACICPKPTALTDHGAIDRLNAALDSGFCALSQRQSPPADAPTSVPTSPGGTGPGKFASDEG